VDRCALPASEDAGNDDPSTRPERSLAHHWTHTHTTPRLCLSQWKSIRGSGRDNKEVWEDVGGYTRSRLSF